MQVERTSSGLTPRVSPEETRLQDTDSAVRVALGRYTVDIVAPAMGEAFAVIGAGVGTEPVSVDVDASTVALLLEVADSVDQRTVFETQAWPLAC
jgi:hypothetical protein